MEHNNCSAKLRLRDALESERLPGKPEILWISPVVGSEPAWLGSPLKDIGYHIATLASFIQLGFPELMLPKLIILDCTPISITYLQEMRRQFEGTRGIPVIFLISAEMKQQLSQLVRTGVDDFIFKPVESDELKARVLLKLRTSQEECAPSPTYPAVERRARGERRKSARPNPRSEVIIFCGDGSSLHINTVAREALLNGELLTLSPKEFDLLALLASEPGRVFTDQEILARLWGGSQCASSNDIAQYTYRLRKKLGDHPSQPRWLMNVKRLGYRLKAMPPNSEPRLL